jgi:hypothetical protein
MGRTAELTDYSGTDDGAASGHSPSKASTRRPGQKPSRSGRGSCTVTLLKTGAGTRGRPTTRKPYQSDELDTDIPVWSHQGMAAASELYRRAAVDLGRVASALCPAR